MTQAKVTGARCASGIGVSCLFTGRGTEDSSEAKDHVHGLETAQETAGRGLMLHSCSESAPGVSSLHPVTAQS